MKNMKEYLIVQRSKDITFCSSFMVLHAFSKADALRTYAEIVVNVKDRYLCRPEAVELVHGKEYRL